MQAGSYASDISHEKVVAHLAEYAAEELRRHKKMLHVVDS